jgi:adenine-specific DNA-methyltransferase
MPYDITRTELVWPGKYDEEGKRREIDRVSLPFQVIERVNESRATREAETERNPTLFDIWQGDSAETFAEGWRNKLIWGDNKLVMSSLLDQFAGKIDLIYIDPPFATGADFVLKYKFAEDGFDLTTTESQVVLEKAPSLTEEKVYRDTWGAGRSSYLEMIYPRIELIRDLLAPTGLFVLHLDDNVGHEAKVIVDEVFGTQAFRGEVVWQLGTGAKSRQFFSIQHNHILFYSRGEGWTFNADGPIMREPFAEGSLSTHFRNVDSEGRRYRKRTVGGKDYIYYADEGRLIGSVWTDAPSMTANSPIMDEATGYPTQKPEKLLHRVIAAITNPGDLVADFFCGSGTTQAVSEKLGRRWIGADLGRFAIHTTRKRLLGIENCKPFEVLNLGKYERKYWQVATFGEDLDKDGVIALYEYVAFILKLYGATPATGLAHLHGKVGRAFVHVGAVDSPVTIDEIVACVDECIALKTKELHILGWEWEMGLHDPMTYEAKSRGVQLVLRQIPREVMEQQAAAKGDVAFFELAYLDVEIKPRKGKREFAAHLRDFVIPNPELVPDDVRSKIKKWSNYVDYWAVDWTFADDTFIQGWVTYRTRKDRSLDLESDPHTYDAPGEYAVMVKVIDIFGNDTSKIIRVTVS